MPRFWCMFQAAMAKQMQALYIVQLTPTSRTPFTNHLVRWRKQQQGQTPRKPTAAPRMDRHNPDHKKEGSPAMIPLSLVFQPKSSA
mmetsp:Transcript_125400/g.187282  ORF Transcript_125400/g.187282 Transcript_125400/m.187282 type:complete len:86 (-) Transcript_125400:254-511(-)